MPRAFTLLILGLALVAPASCHGAETSRAAPNFLLIISDDHAWTDYGFMGHPHVRTPRLDRLAAESLCFPRGYVPASLCCPSLASIITGLFPHQHRIVCNDPPRPAGMTAREFHSSREFSEGRARLESFLEAVPTLPRLLAAHGYLSLQTGKWWQGNYARGGFTHGMTTGEREHGGRHGDVGLEIGRKTLQPIRDFIVSAEDAGRPWLVWYAPMMPHNPHTPPQRLLDHYVKLTNSIAVARYWAMIEWFDETCGELLDFIGGRASSSNTVVVFLADNGWITDPADGLFAPRSKQSPYDGGLRTPILLNWPGRIPARRESTPVSSIDLAPTILKLAGIRPPDSLPGVDLLDRRAVRARRAVFGACFRHDGVDLDEPASGLRWRWVVAGDWKLIAPAPWNEPGAAVELYHVASDPGETRDLSAEEPRRVRRLQKMLQDWWEPPMIQPEPAR